MAIETLIEKYEVNKYQDEQWRTSSTTYDKLPIGFDLRCSFDQYSKIKPQRYNHMAHMKIDRRVSNDSYMKKRCNVSLMDKYQYY